MSEKRPRPRPISEDLAAWDAVARSVKPLVRKPRGALPVPKPLTQPPPSKPVPKPPQKSQGRLSPRPEPVEPLLRQPLARRVPPIEDRVVKAIRRGQTPIDMRLDLHGETQTRAHKRLEQVMATGLARGARVLLVVTGTGMRRRLDAEERETTEGGPGVLRRMLPHWLAAPPLSDWVIGVSQAAQNHGGTGAFYILLRRQRTL